MARRITTPEEGGANEGLVGQVLAGTYEIVRKIGAGGMGEIYEAKHVRLPKRFAIKVMTAAVAADELGYKRFRREAEMVSGLGSPHIAQVIDFNTLESGHPYMVMEFLDGEDLSSRLERGPLAPEDLIWLSAGLIDALTAAHGVGIVHRDLKPENIFLARGGGPRGEVVKLLDFGAARPPSVDRTTQLTTVGQVVGTPWYMSPEQAHGRKLDPRSDQFSLAIVFYAALTGHLPFEGAEALEVMMQISRDPYVPIRSHLPDLSAGVEDVFDRALAKKPADRYADVVTFGAALEAALSGKDERVRPVPDPESVEATPVPPPPEPASKAVRAAIGGAVAVGLVGALAAGFLALRSPPGITPSPPVAAVRPTPARVEAVEVRRNEALSTPPPEANSRPITSIQLGELSVELPQPRVDLGLVLPTTPSQQLLTSKLSPSERTQFDIAWEVHNSGLPRQSQHFPNGLDGRKLSRDVKLASSLLTDSEKAPERLLAGAWTVIQSEYEHGNLAPNWSDPLNYRRNGMRMLVNPALDGLARAIANGKDASGDTRLAAIYASYLLGFLWEYVGEVAKAHDAYQLARTSGPRDLVGEIGVREALDQVRERHWDQARQILAEVTPGASITPFNYFLGWAQAVHGDCPSLFTTTGQQRGVTDAWSDTRQAVVDELTELEVLCLAELPRNSDLALNPGSKDPAWQQPEGFADRLSAARGQLADWSTPTSAVSSALRACYRRQFFGAAKPPFVQGHLEGNFKSLEFDGLAMEYLGPVGRCVRDLLAPLSFQDLLAPVTFAVHGVEQPTKTHH